MIKVEYHIFMNNSIKNIKMRTFYLNLPVNEKENTSYLLSTVTQEDKAHRMRIENATTYWLF